MNEYKIPVEVTVSLSTPKIRQHFYICNELSNIFKKKNNDYGDSFHKTYEEFGPVSLAIRLQDKVSRLAALTTSKEQMVKDESIRDTLLDIANYAILGIMELDGDSSDVPSNEETAAV